MFPFARSKSEAGLSGGETMGLGSTGSASATGECGIGVVGERRRLAATTAKPATSATTIASATITKKDDESLVPFVATGAGVVVALLGGGSMVTTAVQEPKSSRRLSSLMPSERAPPSRACSVVRAPTSNGPDAPIRATNDQHVRSGAGQCNPGTGDGHFRPRPGGATRSMGAGPKCICPVALIVSKSPERR